MEVTYTLARRRMILGRSASMSCYYQHSDNFCAKKRLKIIAGIDKIFRVIYMACVCGGRIYMPFLFYLDMI